MYDWIVSDTHFGHRNIIALEPHHRPFATIEEHDEELVARWNARVGPTDRVLHLGDVFFGQGWRHLDRLNGVKDLVRGNHDHYPRERYVAFRSFTASVMLRHGVIATHLPIVMEDDSRWTVNMHGHHHSRGPLSPRHLNVSLEHTDLAPLHMTVLQQRVRDLPTRHPL